MRLDRSRIPDPRARHELFSRALGDWDGDDAGRCRILLLTSGLGLGHVRAAQAIEAALDDSATVRTLDLWSLMHPGVAQAVHETYLSLVQNYPQLYERLYTLDEHTWRQILQSESGPPPAVLEVLELISAIAADVVVGKPGGISVAEALACGRPLLATRSLGGQEGFNIAFLQSHEVGGLVADGELLDRLAALLHNPEALQAMQMRAWQQGRREGARRVAQIAVDLAASRESAMYR